MTRDTPSAASSSGFCAATMSPISRCGKMRSSAGRASDSILPWKRVPYRAPAVSKCSIPSAYRAAPRDLTKIDSLVARGLCAAQPPYSSAL
eukprot:2485337-Prymnesium_polylepis.1